MLYQWTVNFYANSYFSSNLIPFELLQSLILNHSHCGISMIAQGTIIITAQKMKEDADSEDPNQTRSH